MHETASDQKPQPKFPPPHTHARRHLYLALEGGLDGLPVCTMAEAVALRNVVNNFGDFYSDEPGEVIAAGVLRLLRGEEVSMVEVVRVRDALRLEKANIAEGEPR